MFGFLYGLFAGGVLLKEKIENDRHDAESRQKAINKGLDWYTDHKLNRRSIYNGHRIRRTCKNGFDVLWDEDTKSIIRNYTVEGWGGIDNYIETVKKEVEKNRQYAIEHKQRYYVKDAYEWNTLTEQIEHKIRYYNTFNNEELLESGRIYDKTYTFEFGDLFRAFEEDTSYGLKEVYFRAKCNKWKLDRIEDPEERKRMEEYARSIHVPLPDEEIFKELV